MPDNAAPQGTAVTTRQSGPVGQFQAMLESRARDIQAALPAHISPDKFQRTVMTAVAQNQDLLKADRNSLVLACYKAAQDGLLPDGREAALVTFNTRFKDPTDNQWKSRKLVQYMPMVYGLRKKILQSGEVVALELGVVYAAEVEAGHFYYEVGKYPPLGHRPMLTLTADQAADGNIVGAYSIATMKDGTKSYEFMRRFEIDKVRECSQTGATRDRKGDPREPSGPWVDWYPEQAKKTVARRHSKTLPMSGDVIIDVEGRELEHGASAALALGTETPDEPALITDETPHDPETGEIIEDGSDNAADEANQPEEEPKPARGRQRRAEPEKAEEANPPAPAEDERTLASEIGLDEPPVAETLDDHPASKKADEILAKFAASETVIDLEKHYKAHETDLSAMPDDIYDNVMGGYNRHRVRLGASRVPVQQTETAGAK